MKKLIKYLKQKECGFGLSSFIPSDIDKENIERLYKNLTFKEKFEARNKYGWFFEKHSLTNLVQEPIMNSFEFADFIEINNCSAKRDAQSKKIKTTLTAIALCYLYLREVKLHKGINEQNRDDIAKEFNFLAKNSGRKLHDIYKKLFYEKARLDVLLSENKLSKNTLIKNITNAIELLKKIPNSGNAIEKSEAELKKAENQ